MSRSALVLCLLAAVCGAAHPSRLRGLTSDDGGRIYHYWPASISQFPWQVSLEYLRYGRFDYFCSGSIISSTWVLTAAYCTTRTWTEEVYVRAGSSFCEHDGTVYIVAARIAHKYYNRSIENDYDVGLLQMAEPIILGSRVQAVNLATSRIDGLTDVNVTSWGWEKEKPQLYAFTTRTEHHDYCIEEHAIYGTVVTERMICASGMKRDGLYLIRRVPTGGPMVVGDMQYGIVSQRKEHGHPYSRIYTDVAAVRSWITEKTGV